MTHGLGRRHAPDDRDLDYPAQRRLPERITRTWRYWWARGARLDQGGTGTCVGHAWVHMLENSPVTRPGTLDPYDYYRQCVGVDEWRDNDGEAQAPDSNGLQFGTSVRAGAKVAQGMGLITAEYLWAFDLDTVVGWVLERGPVVLGTNWYDSMWDTDEDGFLHIADFAGIAGGHAYCMDGVNVTRRVARCLNSWGSAWGREGSFWLTFKDLERLIAEDGEAAMAVELAA